MLDSHEFLERERRRLEEHADALAKDKERILPKPRYAEPPRTPEPTMHDFRKWQWSILGIMLLLNVGIAIEWFKAGPERIPVVVEEDQVRRLQDEVTGKISYFVELKSDDLGPYVRRNDAPPVPVWAGANAVLLAALAYTRYRMRQANCAVNATPA